MTVTEAYTVHRRFIPQIESLINPNWVCGRHVHHDSRSLAYQVQPDGTVSSAAWQRFIDILNQGNVGACTGNAATGQIGTAPIYATLSSFLTAKTKPLVLNEATALVFYSAAETIDGDGPYPPNDNGSSGLSVAKAVQNAGYISGYLHITSLAAAQTAIQKGAFIVGSNWYTSMDSPNSTGVVTVSGTVRGGHEYECIAYDTSTDLWKFANSWGPDFGVSGYFYYNSASFSRLLSEDGDATQFVPLSQPAPTPTPQPTPTPPSPTPTPTPTPSADPYTAAMLASGDTWEKTIFSRLTKAAKFKAAFDAWKTHNNYS